MSTAGTADIAAGPATRRLKWLTGESAIMLGGIVALSTGLVVFIVIPLYAMLSKSVEGPKGDFVGLTNFAQYFSSVGLVNSIWNSLAIAAATMAVATV
ncbi:MAG: hypothetical protein VX871_10320, partial [Pseudomonadota bacterium]|nr:hypothetical protein [Pseudomonadota bacterium]